MTLLTSTHFPTAKNANYPAFDVEVAFGSLPTEGPIWRTIASDVRGFSSVRGRPREFDRFSAGRMTATLDNNARDFDPEYSSSPHYGHVLPEKRVRVLASYGGTQYVVFDGFVDGWPQEWQDFGKDATVQLSATDGFKILSQVQMPDSFFEFAVGLNPPEHRWRLTEASVAAGTFSPDTGRSTSLATGTYNGSASVVSEGLIPYGPDSTSIDFTHADRDSIQLANISLDAPSSVAAWFKITTTDTALTDVVFMINAGSAYGYLAVPASGTLLGGAAIPAGRAAFFAYDATEYNGVYSSGRVDDGAVYHVVGTAESTAGLLIYVNGVDVTTAWASSAGQVDGANTHAAIGNIASSLFSSGFYGLNGQIDDLAVYERALSAQEVADLFNAGDNALSGDATGTRVRRVLDYAGWPGYGLSTSADRDLDTGSSTVGEHNLSGGSALDYLQTLHDTEQGQMYMGLDGALSSDGVFKFVWRQRHALITASRSNTSQATFSDSGALRYADLELSYDETKVYNEARVTRTGGADQVTQDATSQGRYFRRTYEKSGLLYSSDNDSFDHATWAVNRYKDPATRIEAVIIKPLDNPSGLWPQVLGREIGDRITVERNGVSKEVIIEGKEIDYDGEDWTTTFRCSPADLGPYWLLDDATFSVLDTSTVLAF